MSVPCAADSSLSAVWSTDYFLQGTTCSTEDNFLYCIELRAPYNSSSGWWESRMLIASGHGFLN